MAAERFRIYFAHGFPNAMREKPGRLIGYAEHAV
jgi:hypothetical protein